MTTLLTLPGSTAYHLPAPGAPPVPLARGDLTLSLLPADPPRRAAEQLALSVGQTSFLLAPNSPVRKTKSNAQHASLIFTPAPPAEGQGIGTVRIDMKDSSNPDEWEDVEHKCSALEAELRARDLWEATELFVDDENETGGPQVGPKVGWGSSIAGAITGGVSSLFGRLTGRGASDEVLPTARGPYDGGYPPSPADTPPASASASTEDRPQHFKALAEHSWAQATIAARGIGEAAAAVGGAVGQSAKNAYDGIKDGVSERDDLPALPAKDAPKPPAKAAANVNVDKPVPAPPAAALDEVDALDAPVVAGAVKDVKLNEVQPITPDEPDHPVENIVPEPVKEQAKPLAEKPAEAEKPVEAAVEAEADKPVEEAVKELSIEDKPAAPAAPAAAAPEPAAESAEEVEIKEEAAAIVAASDAEVKAEEAEAQEESAVEAAAEPAAEPAAASTEEPATEEPATEAKEAAAPVAEDKPKAAGGKKKNKKNKKKN